MYQDTIKKRRIQCSGWRDLKVQTNIQTHKLNIHLSYKNTSNKLAKILSFSYRIIFFYKFYHFTHVYILLPQGYFKYLLFTQLFQGLIFGNFNQIQPCDVIKNEGD